MRQSGMGRRVPVRARPPRRAPRRRPCQRPPLAEGLAQLEGVALDPAAVETNIVIFWVSDAPALVQRVADAVELTAVDARQVRAVTHMDVDRDGIERAVAAIGDALKPH